MYCTHQVCGTDMVFLFVLPDNKPISDNSEKGMVFTRSAIESSDYFKSVIEKHVHGYDRAHLDMVYLLNGATFRDVTRLMTWDERVKAHLT